MKESIFICFLSLLLIALIATGNGYLPYSKTYNHYSELPEPFKEEVLSFKQAAEKMGKDVSRLEETKFKIADLKWTITTYLGSCNIESNNIIFPSTNFKNNVVWHELGHCVFKYPHTDEPEDIMYSISNPLQKMDDQSKQKFFMIKVKDKKELAIVKWFREQLEMIKLIRLSIIQKTTENPHI